MGSAPDPTHRVLRTRAAPSPSDPLGKRERGDEQKGRGESFDPFHGLNDSCFCSFCVVFDLVKFDGPPFPVSSPPTSLAESFRWSCARFAYREISNSGSQAQANLFLPSSNTNGKSDAVHSESREHADRLGRTGSRSRGAPSGLDRDQGQADRRGAPAVPLRGDEAQDPAARARSA